MRRRRLAFSETGTTVRIEQIKVYHGPTVWAPVPVVRIELDAPVSPASDALGAARALVEAQLTALARDGMAVRLPVGGDEEDDAVVSLVEQVAVWLQRLTGDDLAVDGRVSRRPRDGVSVVFPYLYEEVGTAAGRLAVDLVAAAVSGDRSTVDVAGRFASEVLVVAERVGYGPSTREIVAAARRRGIPIARPEEGRLLVVLGQGAAQRRVWATATDGTSLAAAYVAGDKGLAARMLRDALLPVPAEAVVESADDAAAAARRMGYPIVVKPLDGNHGRGVVLDIEDEATVRTAFDTALTAAKGSRVIVQRQLGGNDYRALVVGGNVVAVAERVPAHVVGDGHSTVRRLVEIANADPRRGDGHARPLTRLRVDAAAEALLAAQGLSLDEVPQAGRTVRLARPANMSTGGTSIDRTDEVHPANRTLLAEAAAVVGLDIAGIDVVTPDIARPMTEDGGGIVEINTSPGFRMHTNPSVGNARAVGDAVVDMLFPNGATGRVPTVAVSGTNGKTTTTRMVGHLLRAAGHRVGLTTTDGIYVGDRLLEAGDMAGPSSARAVLRHPLVEAAALESARGGILRDGLGFDTCDVAIVTNVSADHLGLGGVETLEDLAEVKQVVAASVRPGGASVLNADDPRVLAMAPSAGGEVILFGADADAAPIREHLARGGRAAVLAPTGEGEALRLLDGETAVDVVSVADIPATIGGRLRVNALNALAAAAAAWALGIPPDVVRQGLTTFRSGFETTPGRFNLLEVEGRQVIIDYAHNVAALEAMGDVVRRFGAPRSVAMLAIPGDRSDEDARALARVAARIFDGVVIREGNTRGRSPGETAGVLREAVLAAGMAEEEVRVVLDEVEAAHAAVDHARPGDLAVIFVTRPKLIWEELLARAAGARRSISLATTAD